MAHIIRLWSTTSDCGLQHQTMSHIIRLWPTTSDCGPQHQTVAYNIRLCPTSSDCGLQHQTVAHNIRLWSTSWPWPTLSAYHETTAYIIRLWPTTASDCVTQQRQTVAHIITVAHNIIRLWPTSLDYGPQHPHCGPQQHQTVAYNIRLWSTPWLWPTLSACHETTAYIIRLWPTTTSDCGPQHHTMAHLTSLHHQAVAHNSIRLWPTSSDYGPQYHHCGW